MRIKQFLRAFSFMMLLAAAGESVTVYGQGRDVPVYSPDNAAETRLRASAEKLRLAGKLIDKAAVMAQLVRSNCSITVPKPASKVLSSRELWSVARAAHLRVGWYYLCNTCSNRHLNLAAGYAIARAGIVVTCHHVVKPPDNMKQGELVVANEEGEVFAVTEVLAASAEKDVCIIRADADDFKPLPLKTDTYPGDRCVCFSDPLGERGYYSDGIVSRYLNPVPPRHVTNGTARRVMGGAPPLRLNVTTDWAPGSSGAAVLDECGNAIGHVTSIATLGDRGSSRNPDRRQAGAPLITLHEAVSAHDVLSLMQKPGK